MSPMAKISNLRNKSVNIFTVYRVKIIPACWVLLIVLIYFSITHGNYTAVLNGVDSFGNICSQNTNQHFENVTLSGTDTSQKRFLLYFDFNHLDSVLRLCVESCPNSDLEKLNRFFTYFESQTVQICRYDFNILRSVAKGGKPNPMSRRGPCPLITFESLPYRNVCVFHGPKHIIRDIYSMLNSGGLDQFFFMAVYLTWDYVAILCGFALLTSLVLLVLMLWLTSLIAWFIWLLTIIVNAVLCIVLFLRYNTLPEIERDPDIFYLSEEYKPEIKFESFAEYQANNITILSGVVFTAAIDIVLVILILFLFKHLKELKFLFEEGRICIRRLPGLCIPPAIALFTIILFIFLSGYTLICLTTASSPTKTPITDTMELRKDILYKMRAQQQITYVESKMIRRTFWAYVLGFFWTIEFIFAFEEFCLGATVVFWCFKLSLHPPSIEAISDLFKFHLGTIAKGSAFTILLKIPKFIAGLACKCLKRGMCRSWIDHVQSLSHNAYPISALETTDFSPAAEIAQLILTKNTTTRMESIMNVFDFVLFLAKLSVASLTGLLGFMLLKDKNANLVFYMAPVVFSSFCAFCIAHVVFSICEMTIETLVLCMCKDEMINGKTRRLTKSNLGKFFENFKDNHVAIINIKENNTTRNGERDQEFIM